MPPRLPALLLPALLFVAALFGAACNSPHNSGPVRPPADDGAPPGDTDLVIDFTGNNNGVELDGPSFPGGPDSPSALHHTVPAAAVPDHPSFALLEATVARPAVSNTSGAYVILPVQNIDSRPYCEVTVDTLVYRGLGDSALGTTTLRGVAGSVGRVNTLTTNTCLAPGEIGYFCDVLLGDVYDSIARLDVTLAASPDRALHDLAAHLAPVSYTYDAMNGLVVSLTNDGSAPATVYDGGSLYLMLDADRAPLWFHGLQTPTSPYSATIAVDGAMTLRDPDVAYHGTAARLLLLFAYEDE
ncbi:MAG: hypothetical protein HY903_16490 [Deltaproteobacteria bacterium]|nr:hypothetical protein [Deltaproteobacteria bacterium]